MKLPLSSVQNQKIGTCPHGLPQGACPICNGMGGGGGASVKKADKKEMSWSECYIVWQQMQKAKNFKQAQNEALQAKIAAQHSAQLNLNSVAQKTANIIAKMTDFVQNTKPNSPIPAKLLAFSAKLALPVLNTIKNIAEFANKTLNAVKEKLADISDKLNAIFGELKNSVEKKISDSLKDFKKKFKSLFEIFVVTDAENEKGKME